MKTAGVIGGLGPETTAEFYLEVVFGCRERNKDSMPPVLIWNVPLNYRIEEDAIKKGAGEERCIPYLIDAAGRLEQGGADFLVMPCNSLHVFIDEVRTSVRIPVLSIVEETVKFLKRKKVRKIGILATSIALKRKLYDSALLQEGIALSLPDESDQAHIGRILHNIVRNRHANKDKAELINILNKFGKKGVKMVLLACTDLQLLVPRHPTIRIYDTMKILADATVREILR